MNITNIPNEWLEYILTFLPIREKISLQRTNKRIRRVVSRILRYDVKYFYLNIIFLNMNKVKKSKVKDCIDILPNTLGYYKVIERLRCNCSEYIAHRYPSEGIEELFGKEITFDSLDKKIFSYLRVDRFLPRKDINRYIKGNYNSPLIHQMYYPYHFMGISKDNIRKICKCRFFPHLCDYFYFIGYTSISEMMQRTLNISPFFIASIPKMNDNKLLSLINKGHPYLINILYLLHISHPNRYKKITENIPIIRESFEDFIYKDNKNKFICISQYYCCDIEKLEEIHHVSSHYYKDILILRWLVKRESRLLPTIRKFDICEDIIFSFIIINFHREKDRTKYLNILYNSMGNKEYYFHLQDKNTFSPSVAMFVYRTRNIVKWIPKYECDNLHPINICIDMFYNIIDT
jgi:predicted nucleotidyltransferase